MLFPRDLEEKKITPSYTIGDGSRVKKIKEQRAPQVCMRVCVCIATGGAKINESTSLFVCMCIQRYTRSVWCGAAVRARGVHRRQTSWRLYIYTHTRVHCRDAEQASETKDKSKARKKVHAPAERERECRRQIGDRPARRRQLHY